MLCILTLNFRSRSFWLSKSISNTTRSLNLAFCVNSDRIGFCALHVGHHGAVTSTRMGFPAACVAANVLASNGLLSNANALAFAAPAEPGALQLPDDPVESGGRSCRRWQQFNHYAPDFSNPAILDTEGLPQA